MSQTLKILNSKEIKHIRELLREQFGYEDRLDVAFFLNEKKERIYIFTKDLVQFDMTRLRIDTMGLYFGTLYEGQLRLTIDGTQLIGARCTKNVLDINHKEMQIWMQGEKLVISQLSNRPETPLSGFVIMRYRHENGTDYLGCGKIGGDTLLNYVPKTRYIRATYDDDATIAGRKKEQGKDEEITTND